MDNYETFNEYLEAQTSANQKIISELRKLIAKISPILDESVKWGNACWLNGNLPVMFVHCKEDYVQFGFFGGNLLNDSNKLLSGKGDFVRHIPIISINDINPDKISTLIMEATVLDYKS